MLVRDVPVVATAKDPACPLPLHFAVASRILFPMQTVLAGSVARMAVFAAESELPVVRSEVGHIFRWAKHMKREDPGVSLAVALNTGRPIIESRSGSWQVGGRHACIARLVPNQTR